MIAQHRSASAVQRACSSLLQVRLWQLAILIVFVAIAIVDIQDHGRREPFLVGLAAAGYAAFGVLCWLAWHGLRRVAPRLAPLALAAVYSFSMGMVFLGAVIAYLLIEHVYLGGALL